MNESNAEVVQNDEMLALIVERPPESEGEDEQGQ